MYCVLDAPARSSTSMSVQQGSSVHNPPDATLSAVIPIPRLHKGIDAFMQVQQCEDTLQLNFSARYPYRLELAAPILSGFSAEQER